MLVVEDLRCTWKMLEGEDPCINLHKLGALYCNDHEYLQITEARQCAWKMCSNRLQRWEKLYCSDHSHLHIPCTRCSKPTAWHKVICLKCTEPIYFRGLCYWLLLGSNQCSNKVKKNSILCDVHKLMAADPESERFIKCSLCRRGILEGTMCDRCVKDTQHLEKTRNKEKFNSVMLELKQLNRLSRTLRLFL